MSAPPHELSDPPWGHIDGDRASVDDTHISEIEEDDVKTWLAMGPGAGYSEVCIVELHDGRVCAWSTWADVTGSGFHHDAYGGDAVLLYGASVEAVLPYLSEQERESLRWLVPR